MWKEEKYIICESLKRAREKVGRGQIAWGLEGHLRDLASFLRHLEGKLHRSPSRNVT